MHSSHMDDLILYIHHPADEAASISLFFIPLTLKEQLI